VCSGRGLSIREILDALRARSTAEVAVRVDPARLRPSDIPVLVGDPSELRAATGWEPRIPLERTLADLLDDWRRRIGGGPPAGG
jgi:GDP-4-dehydro-6-deoxy-D-mannose reductase